MQMLTYSLNRWTTEDLVSEVLRRTAADSPRLLAIETTIIRARLALSDRRFEDGVPPELTAAAEHAGVDGTIEIGIADGEN